MPSLLPTTKLMFLGSNGLPLVGGKVYTYDSGTTNPRPTYFDAAGTVPNTNPIILDSRGEALVYWSGSYRVKLADSSDNVIWTVDSVSELTLSYRTSPTGSLIVPVGSTGQRDAIPQIGYMRWNSTLGVPEIYNGSAWSTVAQVSDVPITSGNFVLTATGITGSPTGMAYWTKISNVVTLYIPSFSGVSNSVFLSLTGLPAAIQPPASKFTACPVFGQDNGTNILASYTINNSAVIGCSIGISGAWTATGNKAVFFTTITYQL